MIGKDLGAKWFSLPTVTCQFRIQDLTPEGIVPTSGCFTFILPHRKQSSVTLQSKLLKTGNRSDIFFSAICQNEVYI